MNQSFANKFWKKVNVAAPNECWQWKGHIRRKGYGGIWLEGKNYYAHRIAYELVKGQIPLGLTIDHLCRNHACCNPSHLEAVTNWENTLRGNNHIGQNVFRTQCKNGHPFDKDNTYISPDGFRQCRACARMRNKYRSQRTNKSV